MGVHSADYGAIRAALGASFDEPLFIIRGQDRLAVPAIARYQTLAIEAECSPDFINGLNEAMGEFLEWQSKAENVETVKNPD